MTLIEMLVVLAIIAIVASISVLAMGTPGRMDGRVEARRLEAIMQLAADRTMIGDTPQALAIAPDSYAVMAWDEGTGAWQESTEPRHALPRGMTLSTSGEQRLFPLGADAGGQAFSLSLASKGQTWTVEFDGITASVTGDPAARQRAGA